MEQKFFNGMPRLHKIRSDSALAGAGKPRRGPRRHQVEVDYIEGDVVVLSDGPATGTSVVTMGAGELYGTEYKLRH